MYSDICVSQLGDRIQYKYNSKLDINIVDRNSTVVDRDMWGWAQRGLAGNGPRKSIANCSSAMNSRRRRRRREMARN